MKNLERSLSLLLGTLSILLSPALAFSQVPFYQGKTITLIRGEAAGGTGDLMMRAEIPFLRKYIPGEPAIVVEYMPGGGGPLVLNSLRFGGKRKIGPVLVITGSLVATAAEVRGSLQVDRVLPKPFRITDLSIAVRELLAIAAKAAPPAGGA